MPGNFDVSEAITMTLLVLAKENWTDSQTTASRNKRII